MDGFGSHTYSFISAAGERHWVKFHFKNHQGQRVRGALRERGLAFGA